MRWCLTFIDEQGAARTIDDSCARLGEVIIAPWLHIENMDKNLWFVSVAAGMAFTVATKGNRMVSFDANDPAADEILAASAGGAAVERTWHVPLGADAEKWEVLGVHEGRSFQQQGDHFAGMTMGNWLGIRAAGHGGWDVRLGTLYLAVRDMPRAG
jgi:hypothetical protein